MKDNMDKYLKGLNENLCSLGVLTETMLSTNRKEQPEIFFRASARAALISERVAVNFRNISEKSMGVKRQELMTRTVENLGIKVEGDNEAVRITLPCLLPHKKSKNNDFLMEPLLYSLHEFVQRENFTKLDNAVLWVKHLYDEALGGRIIRDYDNFELSELLDAVALHLLIDDSGNHMSMYSQSEITTDCRTEIEVMTIDKFVEKIGSKTG